MVRLGHCFSVSCSFMVKTKGTKHCRCYLQASQLKEYNKTKQEAFLHVVFVDKSLILRETILHNAAIALWNMHTIQSPIVSAFLGALMLIFNIILRPRLSWYHNGSRMDLDSLHAKNISRFTASLAVSFYAPNHSHSGEYKCVAKNTVGKDVMIVTACEFQSSFFSVCIECILCICKCAGSLKLGRTSMVHFFAVASCRSKFKVTFSSFGKSKW